MIVIKLSGGLGNNLFQYVAARTLAESKGYRFGYFPVHGIKQQIVQKIFKIFGCNQQKASSKQLVQADLSEYFILGSNFHYLQILYSLIHRKKWTVFMPKKKEYAEGYSFEIVDDQIYSISDWTFIDAGLQSPIYFDDNRRNVLQWLTLGGKYSQKLKLILDQIPFSRDSRCCVHVRRGDYLITDKGLGWDGLGLALPFEYYRHALSLVPRDSFFVFCTDAPEYVEENFGFLDNKLILRNTSEAVDLHMFSHCKYNIIANSTFSWWGAWLNSPDSRVVIAPKYHIGWSKQKWLPWGYVYHPTDWIYVDVMDLLNQEKVKDC